MSKKVKRKKHYHFVQKDNIYRDSNLKILATIIDLIICFLIGIVLNFFLIDMPIWRIKEGLFANRDTIILVSSSSSIVTLQFWSLVIYISMFLFCISLYFFNKTKLRSSFTIGMDLRNITKIFTYASGICLFFILISFFSYCKVDSNGVYYRDVRTYFIEKHYSWNEVNNVKIESYKTKSYKGSSTSANYAYKIEFGSYEVDLTSNNRYGQGVDAIYDVHQMVKKNGIHVSKNIEYEYEGINNFLKFIGE